MRIDALTRLSESNSTEQGIAALNNLLEKTKYAQIYDDKPLQEIIISAGKAYINGDKSIEETLDIIQSKANIYINE